MISKFILILLNAMQCGCVDINLGRAAVAALRVRYTFCCPCKAKSFANRYKLDIISVSVGLKRESERTSGKKQDDEEVERLEKSTQTTR
jgi:hypothetical protein